MNRNIVFIDNFDLVNFWELGIIFWIMKLGKYWIDM